MTNTNELREKIQDVLDACGNHSLSEDTIIYIKDTLGIFVSKKLARDKEEGTREERELIVKLQMIRLGIQVFNKSEQERDEEEKRGLVRRDGGRTMSAFSLIKQIDTEIEKLIKKD